MTTLVQSRDAIVALINTALSADYPTLKVFYENTLSVDLDTVGDRFVRVEVDFDDAAQLTINNNPEHRTYGSLYFTIFVKDGLGVRDTLVLMQYLSDVVKFKQTATYVFGTPRPGKRDARGGWHSYELVCPFWLDSLI